MNTSVTSQPSLQHLLAGLDVLEGLELADASTQGQLAAHLVRQGQTQGVAITEREAQLVAKLVLSTPIPPSEHVNTFPTTAPLKDAQAQNFFKWPDLERTPEERIARLQLFRDPRRWGAHLLKAAGFLALGITAFGTASWVGEWNQHTHFFQQAPLGDLAGSVLVGVCVASLLTGLVGTILWLGEALLPRDAPIYRDRQRKVYQARLDALSTLQLVQVITLLRSEKNRERSRLESKVLLEMAAATLARRETKPGAA